MAAPVRLAKDKETWAELLADERSAAAKLGYSAESWENGDPPACVSAWLTLSAEQRAAAMALGYERVEWDAECGVEAAEIAGGGEAGGAVAGAGAAVAQLSLQGDARLLFVPTEAEQLASRQQTCSVRLYLETALPPHVSYIGYNPTCPT